MLKTRGAWQFALAASLGLAISSAGVVFGGCSSTSSSSGGPDAGTSSSSSGSPADHVHVQLLAFNDFHGNLFPPIGNSGRVLVNPSDPASAEDGGFTPDGGTQKSIPAGGAAYLATHLKQLKAQNPNTLIVSAGDLTGASPLVSALFHDEPSVLVMNAIGLDLNAVGNHEFDHGITELLRLQKGGCHPTDGCPMGVASFPGAKYEYLAANVDVAPNMTLFPPYAIKEIAGERIGFIGMTLEATPTVTSPKNVMGIQFDEEAKTVAKLIPELKSQGVGPIVVLVHQGSFPQSGSTIDECNVEGGAIRDMAYAMDPAVDVIVSAHTHQAYDCPDIDGKLVTSAASFGRVITRIDLEIDKATHKVVQKLAKNLAVTQDVAPDPAVTSILSQYETLAAPLANKVVGHVTADIPAVPGPTGEEPLGDVIADAQLAATAAAPANAQLALMNPGGIRADITYAPTGMEQPGEVTYAECFTVQPFSNALVTVSLTGAELHDVLEQQFHMDGTATILQVSNGFSFTYDTTKPVGMRVDPATITLNGAPIDMGATYRVTMNAFLSNGGDNFAGLTKGTDLVGGSLDLDALVAYLGKNDPLAPPMGGRVVKKP